MAEQVRMPGLPDAVESYLREEARAAYRSSLRGASRPEGDDRAHPLQFDESGFPIRPGGRGIAGRIRRLLNPL
jgi:hypothetical protein